MPPALRDKACGSIAIGPRSYLGLEIPQELHHVVNRMVDMIGISVLAISHNASPSTQTSNRSIRLYSTKAARILGSDSRQSWGSGAAVTGAGFLLHATSDMAGTHRRPATAS